ncbi:DUF6101 family protein [Lichenihabitans psoromatis]|uniref:DUF6101 family protein n=1 Tax=Lichenihabitans psoromatis TaxID=2528642 RepID=UPI0010361616|nr:DUF6101 family protein [Lichenihabitans psoromatis]
MFNPQAHAQADHTISGRPVHLPSQTTDRRADGQLRSVSLTRDLVRIDRSVLGIAMRVAVPVRTYRGVALSLRSSQDGALSYQLHLLHPDGELSVALDEADHDRDIVADWRLWSRFFRLPALVEREIGLIEEADAALGTVLLGEAVPERRPSRSISKRRPRFLQRRKSGVMSADPVVHGGEAELIARD